MPGETHALDADTTLVTAARLGDAMDVIEIQSLLDSHEIPHHIDGQNIVNTAPHYAVAMNGVQLLVRRMDLARVQELLEAFYDGRRERLELAKRTCPECGSTNAVEVHATRSRILATILTLGTLLIVYPLRRHRCPDCGHRW